MSAGLQHARTPNFPTEAKKVVCVSWVPELAATRELLLRAAGYAVISVLGRRDFSKLESTSNADLLILSHSVPREEKLQALIAFRRSCRAPVLSLLGHFQRPLPGVDYAVEAYNPGEFIDAVAAATSLSRVMCSVGCRKCDLILSVREDVIASAAEGQETTTLKCPYCGATCDYEPHEFLHDPDDSKKSD